MLNTGTAVYVHVGQKPGVLGDFYEHGKLSESSANYVQQQRKIVTTKYFLFVIQIFV